MRDRHRADAARRVLKWHPPPRRQQPEQRRGAGCRRPIWSLPPALMTPMPFISSTHPDTWMPCCVTRNQSPCSLRTRARPGRAVGSTHKHAYCRSRGAGAKCMRQSVCRGGSRQRLVGGLEKWQGAERRARGAGKTRAASMREKGASGTRAAAGPQRRARRAAAAAAPPLPAPRSAGAPPAPHSARTANCLSTSSLDFSCASCSAVRPALSFILVSQRACRSGGIKTPALSRLAMWLRGGGGGSRTGNGEGASEGGRNPPGRNTHRAPASCLPASRYRRPSVKLIVAGTESGGSKTLGPGVGSQPRPFTHSGVWPFASCMLTFAPASMSSSIMPSCLW